MNKYTAIVIIASTVIGVIPYTITHQYSGFEFYNMMKDRTDLLVNEIQKVVNDMNAKLNCETR